MKVAAILLLVIGAVVFVVGAATWFVRDREHRADREARVACGFVRAAGDDAPDKTETFVRLMLRQGADHAAAAARLDDRYDRFARGVEGIGALAGGKLDALDVLAVTEVCGPIA